MLIQFFDDSDETWEERALSHRDTRADPTSVFFDRRFLMTRDLDPHTISDMPNSSHALTRSVQRQVIQEVRASFPLFHSIDSLEQDCIYDEDETDWLGSYHPSDLFYDEFSDPTRAPSPPPWASPAATNRQIVA